MIGNVTRGEDFCGLARYLTRQEERVVWSDTRHTLATDGEGVAAEMQLMSERSVRCKKPVYHLSLSWSLEDAPTATDMGQACDAVLAHLGLSEHQAYLVAHNDTAHAHVHLMVNRVHMETGKAWSASHDYRRIQEVLKELERARGWRITPNRGVRTQERAKLSRGEVQASRRLGAPSFAAQVRSSVGDASAAARSWGELLGALKAKGLRLQRRRGGLVITDGRQRVKLSRVHPSGGARSLEEKYGRTLAAHVREMRGLRPRRRSRRAAGVSTRAVEARTDAEAMGERARRNARRIEQKLFRGDPALRRLYQDMQARLKAHVQEVDLKHARREHGLALERRQMARRAEEALEGRAASFDRGLRLAYVKPLEARRAFIQMAAADGIPAASGEMQRNPARFGSLRMEERRRLWGLVRIKDPGPARRAARLAGVQGAGYLEALRHRTSEPERKMLLDTEAHRSPKH